EKTKQKALCNKIVTEANGFMKAWVQNVEDLITNGSAADAITETWEELTSTEQHFCYAAMDEVTRLNFNEATGVKL
ncbi:hypothetical protein OAT93_01930, partial [bacterium]|nr:hypothetical protein [bacterium]